MYVCGFEAVCVTLSQKLSFHSSVFHQINVTITIMQNAFVLIKDVYMH